MKTAVLIPDPVFSQAEAMAAGLGISRSELYARAVAEFLRRQDRSGISETLNRVLGEDGGPPVDPVLEKMAFESLPREEW